MAAFYAEKKRAEQTRKFLDFSKKNALILGAHEGGILSGRAGGGGIRPSVQQRSRAF